MTEEEVEELIAIYKDKGRLQTAKRLGNMFQSYQKVVLENTQLKKCNNELSNLATLRFNELDKATVKLANVESVLKEIKECIMSFLLTEEYIIVDGKAIANNYHKLLEIIDKGIGEDK